MLFPQPRRLCQHALLTKRGHNLLVRPLARAVGGVTRHRPGGADGLAALADVAAHVVVAALGLGVRCRLVFGSAHAFEVASFGGAVRERR